MRTYDHFKPSQPDLPAQNAWSVCELYRQVIYEVRVKHKPLNKIQIVLFDVQSPQYTTLPSDTTVLVELVPTFSPGLNIPRSNCYNTHQCTAAVAAMPWSSSCFCYGRESVGKFNKRKRTDKHRQTDFSNTRPMECRQTAAASGLCCLCQPPHRGREIDEDSDR